MKKLLVIMMALALVMAFAACGAEAPIDAGTSTATDATEETGVDAGTETAQVEAEEEPGQSLVVPGDAAVITNGDGERVLLVRYTFNNTTDETTSAMVALYIQAFQDGVSLEYGTAYGDELPEGYIELEENDWKDIRPGASIECYQPFLLTSDSDVEVEFGEFLGNILYTKTYTVAQ